MVSYAIWGLKSQAHLPGASCFALHVLRFLWIAWIFYNIMYGSWWKT